MHCNTLQHALQHTHTVIPHSLADERLIRATKFSKNSELFSFPYKKNIVLTFGNFDQRSDIPHCNTLLQDCRLVRELRVEGAARRRGEDAWNVAGKIVTR